MRRLKRVEVGGRPRCRSSAVISRPTITRLTWMSGFVEVSEAPCEPLAGSAYGEEGSPMEGFSRVSH